MAATRRRGPIIGAIVMLLGVAILLGGASGGAEAFVAGRAFASGDCPPPSDRTNASLVTRWYEDIVNGEQPEAIDQLLAVDVVVHTTADGTGDEVDIVAAERWVREQLRAYPDLFVRIDALVHEGDFVRAYVTSQGTSLDKAAARGLKPAMWSGTQRFRVACGRIAEIWLVQDDTAQGGKGGVKGGPDEDVALVGATHTSTPVISPKAPTKAVGGAVVTLAPTPTAIMFERPTTAPARKTPEATATRRARATATRPARATAEATKAPTRAARTATARATATATSPRTVQATATRTAGQATRAVREETREATREAADEATRDARDVTPTRTAQQATRAAREATQAATQAANQETRAAREATREATRNVAIEATRQAGQATRAARDATQVAGSPAVGGEATATGCPATDADANKNLVARWYEDIVNGRRPESLRAIVAEDVIVHATGRPDEVGINAARRRVNEQLRIFPDLFVRVEALVAEGDLVVAYVSREGTGAVDAAASPAADQTSIQAGAELFRIECGRIAEIWLAMEGTTQGDIVVTVNEGLGGATTPEATAAP